MNGGGGRMIDDLDLAWEEQARSHRGQRGRRPARSQSSRGRSRKDKGRGKRSFGALFVAFILLVALGAGVYWGVGKVQDFFSAPDYTTTGTETVTIEVKDGDTATEIGNTLFTAGVVKSAKAFVNVASADPRSRNIQVGLYKLFKPMPAKDALTLLLDPDKNRVVNGVTIPEGMITVDIYKKLSKETGIPVNDFQSALEWYKRLLGAEPAFFPNDTEAVWQLAEDRYVYIIEDADRAGGAVSMIWVDDPISEVARIADQGVEPVDVEKHDQVWKYVFHDSDGNETGIGGEVLSPE